MKLILMFSLMLVATSCEKCKESSDEELCTERENNSSGLLNIHGFYYRVYNVNSSNHYEVLCLFRNGIFLDLGVLYENEWNNLETYLSENNYFADANRDKLDWGIYLISDSTISLEKWYPSNDYFRVYSFSGTILNDSTYHIVQSNKCDGSEHTDRNHLYSFRSYIDRPDSTTAFIN